MTTTVKPDMTRTWASAAAGGEVVDPDVTTPGKYADGWEAEIPPFEWMNFLFKQFSQGLSYINDQGIGVWDPDTRYAVGAITKGSNGTLYTAIVEQNGNNPVGDLTNWTPSLLIGGSTYVNMDGIPGVGVSGLNGSGLSMENQTAAQHYLVHCDTSGNLNLYDSVANTPRLLIGVTGAVSIPGSLHLTTNTNLSFTAGAKDQTYIGSDALNTLRLGTNTLERIRIMSDGDIYLNSITADPSPSNAGTAFLNVGSGQINILAYSNTTSSQSLQQFGNPNGLVGSITVSGSSTAFNTSSDPRLKTPFEEITKEESYSLISQTYENKILGKFKWNNDTDGEYVYGYNAHLLIDNQAGLGGTEGFGSRELNIGEKFEEQSYEQGRDKNGDLLFIDVEEEIEVPVMSKRPKIKKVKGKEVVVINKVKKILPSKIESINGIPTLISEKEIEIEEIEYEEIQVVDEDGLPVVEKKLMVTRKEPLMVKSSVPNVVTPASVDQSKRVPILESALYHAIQELKELRAEIEILKGN